MLLKADLHIHSCYSRQSFNTALGKAYAKVAVDSHNTIEQILSVAHERGLDLVSITDHDSFDAVLHAYSLAQRYGIIVLPGIEITTTEGHLLAYGIREIIPPHLDIRQTVGLIRAQGGIAVPAHPFAPGGIFFMGRNKNLLWSNLFDGLEIFSIMGGVSQRALQTARQFNLAALASTDSKTTTTIGHVYTQIDADALDSRSIIDTIRQRRTTPVVAGHRSRLFIISDFFKTNYLHLPAKQLVA